MKKILVFLLVFSLTLSLSITGFAWAQRAPRGEGVKTVKTADDVFFEDFSSYEEGGLPSTIPVKYTEPSEAEVVEYETPEGKKNVLKLVDNQDVSGGPSATLSVPEHSKPLTLEIRMKHKQTSTNGFGFIMNFTDEAGNYAFRLIRYSGENAQYTFVNSGGSKPLTLGANHDDVWYTVKVRMDPILKQVGIIIESEELKTATLNVAKYANVHTMQEKGQVLAHQLPWYNEYSDETVTKISMNAYGNTCGEYYIDYIKFTENVPEDEYLPERERAESKEAEITSEPVKRLVPNVTNVMFKGDVKYFANPVKLINGRALVDVNEFALWYNLNLTEENGIYKLSGEGANFEFTINSYSYTFNNSAVSTDSAPQILDNCLYIPVKSFATALGSQVSWSEDPEQCVIIE